MAQYVPNFAEPSDPEYAPPVQLGETPVRRVFCRNEILHHFFFLYTLFWCLCGFCIRVVSPIIVAFSVTIMWLFVCRTGRRNMVKTDI